MLTVSSEEQFVGPLAGHFHFVGPLAGRLKLGWVHTAPEEPELRHPRWVHTGSSQEQFVGPLATRLRVAEHFKEAVAQLALQQSAGLTG
jgi:hypothetical protein